MNSLFFCGAGLKKIAGGGLFPTESQDSVIQKNGSDLFLVDYHIQDLTELFTNVFQVGTSGIS